MNRRDFLKASGLAAVMMSGPQLLWAGQDPARRRVLVMIELKGGNDGLNTVVPFADPAYYKLRPGIGIAADKVLRLSERVGLHPALDPLMASWAAKDMALVQGVGYPAPNRSHFRSIEIWDTASRSDQYLDEGWLAQAWEGKVPRGLIAEALVVGDGDDGPTRGGELRTISMQSVQQLERGAKRLLKDRQSDPAQAKNPALAHLLKTQLDVLSASEGLARSMKGAPELGVAFPTHALGRELEVAARLIAAKVPALVLKVSHGSFDTHAGQLNRHETLLKQLGEGLAAFRAAMVKAGRWDDVLVMTYSEFGRRAAQNGSGGTDHGTAAPQLMMGGKVTGGLYGAQPSLTDLQGGDLKHAVDFRELYATVTQRFWDLGAVGAHKPLPLIKG
jgi:uncharacterized protein (DUF1501 family)